MALPVVYELDPAVVEKLNAALVLERTVCEGYHDQEHSYIVTGWKKLMGWFDDRVETARKKRRKLLETLYVAGEIPGTDSMVFKVTDPNDPGLALDQVLDYEQQLAEAYEDLITVCLEKKDHCTRQVGHKLLKITRKTIAKVVEQQNVLAKLGPADYLHVMK